MTAKWSAVRSRLVPPDQEAAQAASTEALRAKQRKAAPVVARLPHSADFYKGYRAGQVEALLPSPDEERLLDAVFAEMAQRGWILLPDGHGPATIRDVFVEARSRLSGDAA